MNPSKSPYRAEIDGLRAFAVLSVLGFHAFPLWFKGGFIGVDVFFVISGFLITSHIFERLNEDTFSISDFFQRRIRRIFPALILVMVSSLLFGWFVLLADEYSQLGTHVASGAAFILNFVLANEVGYFDISAELKPMLHLWSLAVEEQFYIVWPLCLWFAWKKKFSLIALTFFFLLISFFCNLSWVSANPTETFYWPFSRFWELLSGSVLAWFSIQKRQSILWDNQFSIKYFGVLSGRAQNFLQTPFVVNIMSISGFLLLATSTFFLNYSLPFPSVWALLPIFGSLLVIGVGSNAWLNRIFLMNPLAVWFGLISYPLYLWHWPILSFLRIIEDGTPNKYARILALLCAVFLAWVTFVFIEKPIRLGKTYRELKSILLFILMIVVGLIGLFVSFGSFSGFNNDENLIFSKRLENRVGSSSRWYEGKDDWLFLGNSYDHTVEKLRLAIKPSVSEIENLKEILSELTEVAQSTNTKVALLVGPNKSTIYPEYLPDKFLPSDKRYVSFFYDVLKDIPNLILYDPTDDFLKKKDILYYRTDTHWNKKGAFLAYEGVSKKLEIPVPDTVFKAGAAYKGEITLISGIDDFPLHGGDNWIFTIKQKSELTREDPSVLPLEKSFGAHEIVDNSNSLTEKKVWIVGDSFSNALRPFINSTFSKSYYLGHWSKRLVNLSSDLRNAAEKPDIIIIVRVERSF